MWGSINPFWYFYI